MNCGADRLHMCICRARCRGQALQIVPAFSTLGLCCSYRACVILAGSGKRRVSRHSGNVEADQRPSPWPNSCPLMQTPPYSPAHPGCCRAPLCCFPACVDAPNAGCAVYAVVGWQAPSLPNQTPPESIRSPQVACLIHFDTYFAASWRFGWPPRASATATSHSPWAAARRTAPLVRAVPHARQPLR